MSRDNPKSVLFAGPCPRCGGPVPNAEQQGEHPGALSRYDNETFICAECGVLESLSMGNLIPFDIGLYSEEAKNIRLAFMAHEDGRHASTHPEDIEAFAGLGCPVCKKQVA